MHLRITRFHFNPATSEQAVALGREAVTVLEQLPGVRAVYQGVDRGPGTGAIVSLWDTEEQARFSRDASLGALVDRIHAANIQMNPPEIYEVEAGAGGR